jgi:hypothetical protein
MFRELKVRGILRRIKQQEIQREKENIQIIIFMSNFQATSSVEMQKTLLACK